MKSVIILDGTDDVAILRALLPSDLVEACEFWPTMGRSTPVSVARTLVIKHRVPVAILLDTETMDPTAIADTVQVTKSLMRAVAGDVPFEVVHCVPEIETVFFQNSIDYRRIFSQFDLVFIQQFALTQPKAQLQVLFEKGGGPSNLHAFLDLLTEEEVEGLRTKSPIQQLIAFLTNNVAQHAE